MLRIIALIILIFLVVKYFRYLYSLFYDAKKGQARSGNRKNGSTHVNMNGKTHTNNKVHHSNYTGGEYIDYEEVKSEK